jgi:hypothetical protein
MNHGGGERQDRGSVLSEDWVFDRLQDLMMYRPSIDGTSYPPGPGLLTLRELNRKGFVDRKMVEAWKEVVQRIDSGRSFIDDRRLLLAWLDAFELLSLGESLLEHQGRTE